MEYSAPFFGDEIPLDHHPLEIRLRSLGQLFDSHDPSPFLAKDLADDAQDYIIASAEEVADRLPLALVIHLSEPPTSPAEARDAGEAIREHFVRQSGLTRRQFRSLIHHGLISLAIGLAFLSLALITSAALTGWAAASTLRDVFREGLIICGWVAMWQPLQIFLYHWWPVLGERRLYDRLSRMPVQIVVGDSPA